MPEISPQSVQQLCAGFDGEIHDDGLTRRIYATDASVYQKTPALVAFPRTVSDIRRLIHFATRHKTSLIPRAGGTSLAGQTVGEGIVVDVSRYMNSIIEIDPESATVMVQPGIIRDELNLSLAGHGLFFGPETSTSNRATIGGMFGNNSAGANSIVYGVTRDHVLQVTGLLSDGSEVTFGPQDPSSFQQLFAGDSLHSRIAKGVHELLSPESARESIRNSFPDPSIHRRNTGYALDSLMDCSVFGESEKLFNMCNLLCGSEGTLFFATEIKLRCQPLPPPCEALVCVHFNDVNRAMSAVKSVMATAPSTCELIDRFILEAAARNTAQSSNIDFLDGAPAAILVVGYRGNSQDELSGRTSSLIESLKRENSGYSYPVLTEENCSKIWSLRKAGLGVLYNVPGDEKPVTVIEDSAVPLEELPDYIRQINQHIQNNFDTECVNYAHAGAGLIHIRPVFNLKSDESKKTFEAIARFAASLVRSKKGSLSGEHGDGRVRSQLIREFVGPEVYSMFEHVKRLFDPDNIFNRGKIVDAVAMTSDWRFEAEQGKSNIPTVFNFDSTGGLLRATEMCNGTGECRKTHLSGGTMCPSFMATRDEKDSTRARANLLRQSLTDPANSLRPFDDADVEAVLDLCLSCKACKSECPSNIDMSRMKAEFQNGRHEMYGIPIRTRIKGNVGRLLNSAAVFPALSNWLATGITGSWLKQFAGIHRQRSLPCIASRTLRRWHAEHSPHQRAGDNGSVNFFCDEFTNHFDVDAGIAAIELLEALGWAVEIPDHIESGRALISSGMLRRARKVAQGNVQQLSLDDRPLVGIEPSALLTLRDEYPDLVGDSLREPARRLAERSFLLDEFFTSPERASLIDRSKFHDEPQTVHLHNHCHQKALASPADTVRMLQLPENYFVKLIPSGCCGMAGSFGYENEHYNLSMQIGELILFPRVRGIPENEIVAAAGTSCRHQILDGTGQKAKHPAQVLRGALI